MPLKIHPSRKGSKAPRIRGTYRGVVIYRTVELAGGETGREIAAAARKQLAELQSSIERGELAHAEAKPTFVDAALAYVKAGGDTRFLAPLKEYFRDTPRDEIDQEKLDKAAIEIGPDMSPATRNRQIYTPVSAVLRHAMPDRAPRFRRPKMTQGRVVWLEPEDIAALVTKAAGNPRLRAIVIFLTYTGCRLGEALSLEWDRRASCRVVLDQAHAWVAETKNEEPRRAHLPPVAVAELRAIEPETGIGSVFGYRNRWHFYEEFDPLLLAAGIRLPPRVKAHIFRHTYATWMRRLGKTPFDLVDAGVWKDIHSAMRYQHVVATDAASAADDLPVPTEIRAKLVHENDDDAKSTG